MRTIFNKVAISKMHAIYFTIIILFFVITWVAGFNFQKISDNPILYPIGVFYILSPFFLVWSLWRIFNNIDIDIGGHEERQILANAADIFHGHKGGIETELLKSLELDIGYRLLEYKKKMNLADYTGRIFASTAIIIPVITWIYATSLYQDKEKLDNLWALTFSSMTVGFILITIGVTLLRHSKTIQENIYYMEDKIFYLRKLRVVALSMPDKSENLPIYESIYNSLIDASIFSKNSSESGNDESKLVKLYEMLSKQQMST